MMHFPRFISRQLSRFASAEKLFQSTTPFFLPFYHVVSDQHLPYILNYPYFNPEQFENHLDFLLKNFKPVSLEYLIENPNNKEKIFHLSFDDGLRQCADIVAPILLKKGVPATFFINSGFVDNKNLFHRYKASLILSQLKEMPCFQAETFLKENGITRKNILQTSFANRDILDEAADMMNIDFKDILKDKKPYLTTNQIKKLYSQGFSIGGHSHKHPEFWKISKKKQLKHVRKSIDWVVENINPKTKAFAFPFTDDGISADLIKKLNDENICDITFGTAGLKYDEIDSHFQRYPVEQRGRFIQNLKSEFMYFKIRKIVGKATVKH